MHLKTRLWKTKGVWNEWPVALQVTEQVPKNSFIKDVLPSFITKITFGYLCEAVHDIINYPTFICPFESGKCGREGEKLEKFVYLENEKSFLDEIKSIKL